MPWEKRRGRGAYYTRSRRRDGRRIREYLGAGHNGMVAAAEDAQRGAESRARAEALRAEEQHHAAATAPLNQLCQLADLLMKVTLISEG